MDDERIRQLTDEVLAQVRGAAPAAADRSLESRVAALETALAHLPRSGADAKPPADPPLGTVVLLHTHPSRQLLQIAAGGGGECILEPDKPCVHSGCCRTLGH